LQQHQPVLIVATQHQIVQVVVASVIEEHVFAKAKLGTMIYLNNKKEKK